ncbi:hypothetical protein V9L05_17990 [Bernardetia sp. Wsw4-3y2]|uniref:hypothetical protein n=1 Tax=Bernardetia sp. Wsw4-3y2 TaxID=3127471 RepID=UPI0030CC7FF3
MENQNTNPNSVAQTDSSSRVTELLSLHFKSSSSTKTALSFLKVLAILFIASFLWSNIAESSLQFTFPIVALLYIVFVFGQIIIKENDIKLKNADEIAKLLQVSIFESNELEEELASYKQAHQNNKLVVKEWEQAHSYLKAENSNLKENYSKLQDSYDTINGRCNIAEKNAARYKKEIDDSENIIKKAKTEAFIQGIVEYEELVTLKRSIPHIKDEEARRVKEARQEVLEARIDQAKVIHEQAQKN